MGESFRGLEMVGMSSTVEWSIEDAENA